MFSRKELTMTLRALRIATILIIIQSLLFFPAPASRAQDRPTEAEVILAKETADLFMKRLDETGDFSSVIDEMYAEDFIERYIQQEILEGKGSNSSSYIYFPPGFELKRDLLKHATLEDWRRFYIAANNFFYHFIVNSMNKNADDILNGREPDDETIEKIIPPDLIELFKNQPVLKDLFDLDDDRPGVGEPEGESQSYAAREESGQTSIETPEEMREFIETLQEGLRLILEKQGDHALRLTESAKSAIEVTRLKLNEDGGMMEPRIKVSDEKRLGLPPGTRILVAPTPIFYWLEIADMNGKQKIVQARLLLGD
jgi:hypothetical protein